MLGGRMSENLPELEPEIEEDLTLSQELNMDFDSWVEKMLS